MADVATYTQAKALVDLADDEASWRIRRTERVRFDDDVTVEYTVVLESTLSAQVLNEIGTVHGVKSPTPLASMPRSPMQHVRCFMEGEEIGVAPRGFERSVYASWVARKVFANSDWQTKLKLGSTGCSKVELEDDVVAACHWELDRPIVAGADSLNCKQSRQELWASIAETMPSAAARAKQLQNKRTIIALPHFEDKSKPQHVCFVMRHHGTTKRFSARLSRVMTGLSLSRRDSDGNFSEFMLWRDASGAKPSGLKERIGAFWWDWRLRLDYLLPMYRRPIAKIEGSDASGAGRIVVADGSAMHIAQATGREAERIYVSRWRWPWEIPDCTVIDIPVGSIDGAESYHFELDVPAGTYIKSAVLRVRNMRLYVPGGDPHSEVILVEDDDAHPDRAHLHFSRKLSAKREDKDIRYHPACVRVVLRPTWHDGLRVAAFAQAVSVLTLIVLVLTFGLVALGDPPLIPLDAAGGDTNANADAMVALVTLAPAIALSWIARHNEHMLTKQVQGRLRFRLGTAAVMSYVAALTVALGASRPYVFWVLATCAAIGGLCLAITLRSGLYSRQVAR